MTRAFVSRRHTRSFLFISVVLLFAFLTASCCPPALLDRAAKKPEKAGMPAQLEKQKRISNK